MDQYLPGEGQQAVMVLRFLASSGCEESVMKLLEEKPFIKYFIPPQPPTMSRSDYVRHLASVRPFLSLSFPDLLSDYAKSKWMVSKLVQEMNPGGSPLRPSDSLVTQLKQLVDVINNNNCHQTPSPKVIMVDVSINTEKILPNDVSLQTDSSTIQEDDADVSSVEIQTEISAIQEEDNVEVVEGGEMPAQGLPLMFYNSLISDTSIPQKLATAINQHAKGDELELPPQFESEIDKFLLDLLNVDVIQKQQQPMLDEGLTTLFGDVDSVIAADQLQNCSSKDKEPPPQIPTASITPMKPKRIIPKPAPTGTPKPHPVFQFSEDAPQNVTAKRVDPRPGRLGQHQHPPYTVVTTLPTNTKPATAWESLGRKPIQPKVPSSSQPETALLIDTKSPEKSTPIIDEEELESKLKPESSKKSQKTANNNSINKRKACSPVKLTPEKAKQNVGSTPAAQPSSSVMITSTPQQQKSATPSLPKYVPVTESVPPAVIMPSNSANKSSSSSKCKESDRQGLTFHQYHTPDATAAVGDKPEENNLIRLTNLSEVTPVLDAFEAAQKISSKNNKQPVDNNKNNSGRILRSMVAASADKFKATSTQANLYGKSFSTPRKKHVRNLRFDTPPPSLKADNDQQQVKRVSGLTLDISTPPGLVDSTSFSVEKTMTNGAQACQTSQAPTSSSIRKRKAGEQHTPRLCWKFGQWTIEEEDSTGFKSSVVPDLHISSIKNIKESTSQMANKIVANSSTAIGPPQKKAKRLSTTNGALPLSPTPEELIYTVPPTPAGEVEVVTTSSSPSLEEGEIEDDNSGIVVDVDEEEDEPAPSLKKQTPPLPQHSKSLRHSPSAIIKIPEKKRSKTEKVKKPKKANKRRKSSSSQQKKKENSSSRTKTRAQLTKELFGTDTDETPVKLRKEEKVTEETPVKKKKANPVKDVEKVKKVQKEEANVLPFDIEPGPIAFLDPTPVKKNKSMTKGVMDYNQDSSSNSLLFSQSHPSSNTLITPMKTLPNQNNSPPLLNNLPPTPRYIFHDPETTMDSNSTSNFTMFPSADGTPFKFGPPPTPGKNLIPISSTATLISNSSSSSSMPPPPLTSEINNKRSKAHGSGQDLKKILPKLTMAPQPANPTKPANIPRVQVNPSKPRPPLNHMTSFTQIDGKPVFLAMTEERTLLTQEQSNLKSSTEIKESSTKSVPTTRFTGALKHFNLTRFLQKHSHPT